MHVTSRDSSTVMDGSIDGMARARSVLSDPGGPAISIECTIVVLNIGITASSCEVPRTLRGGVGVRAITGKPHIYHLQKEYRE
jgi:hypothetical protein